MCFKICLIYINNNYVKVIINEVIIRVINRVIIRVINKVIRIKFIYRKVYKNTKYMLKI